MKHSFTRITTPLLIGVVFGFFYSCSSLPLVNKKDKTSKSEQTVKDVKEKLSQTREELKSSPSDPDLYYRKGYLLSELAQMTDPFQRNPLYSEMNQSLEEANSYYGENNPGKGKVDELLQVAWSNEHNQGVQIIQTDSTLTGEDYYKAAIHFNNATTILPDSSISYQMEASAYYRNHQRQKAITTLETARENIDPLPSSMLEQLAFLYLENDEPQKAVEAYEEADSFSDENLNLVHGLANAYIAAGQHKKAAELLNELATEHPGNIIYAESLGTELFFVASQQLGKLENIAPDDSSAGESILAAADSLFERAEHHLIRAYEQKPEDIDMIQSLAKFYRNAAAAYQKAIPYLSGPQKEKVNTTIREYLTNAIPLLTQLADEQPGEMDHWKALYEVYSYLGMKEKAGEAMKKIGQ